MTSMHTVVRLSVVVLAAAVHTLPAGAQVTYTAPPANTPPPATTAPPAGRQSLAAPQPPPAPGATIAPTGFAGVWFDETRDGAIEIKPCDPPAVSQMCGTIVWLKAPLDKKGQPFRDGYNEDPKLRRRPICGLPLLGGLKRQVGGSLDEGWIYDPRKGQAFDLALSLKGPDRLEVTGYKGFKFLSKTFMWTRAPADLPRCQPPA